MSGIMDDIKSSVTGSTEPAYIVVHDFRKSMAWSGRSAAEALPDIARQALNGGGAGAQNFESQDKVFRVQYNPSELEFYASAPQERVRDLRPQGSEENRIVQESPLPGKVELSMSLWFDKMSQASSFMLEKSLAPTSVTGVTNIAKSFAKEQTVRDEVEGFIAALRHPHTQWITLHWADLSFSGVLFSVNAQYTMFSMTGLPVRARVSIRVRQEAIQRDMDDWVDRDFEAAFGGDRSNLVLPEQRISNLLNLGL
ncbi:MAG: hypothetical protein LBP73_03645 [Clostridiales Family XIII bacterium]|jgi:hypothetical protein|nr:hypothetical protein [Clostridiales Family XIII bacterium]